MTHTLAEPEVYQGQFGEFTITKGDRLGVVLYRAALMVAALCFDVGTGLVLGRGDDPTVLRWLSPLYTLFSLALGASLLLIHIYMKPLHRALQAFWLVGAIAAIAVAHLYPEPFVQSVYLHPQTLLGVGFTFAALTGIFFKEAFCFNRLETKLLTPLVPLLLLGHLAGVLSPGIESKLLLVWAILMLIFAVRKCVQAIPPDIGDKSVFEYLRQESQVAKSAKSAD
ncbi:DUF2301 domain-containing membrane protein [Thermoleptolyngbya sichuanensis A183]|uniref:DUF2301 domain-containing membrane protein n=1 Tax=Thermoleptolyngbya sichuanensis A183 TaxID=2737172 RepID=A0A6M8BHX6_9CYAN|nr:MULTISPECIES: DUF2301 domain-containing membrane protein [Thermoleptolyngbya]QKD83251.1 DUF2301 domain-containing membrane protein [Thermoleptolyngbya sichuanensis A183]